MRVALACALLVVLVPLPARGQLGAARPVAPPLDAPAPEGTVQTRHLSAQVVGEPRVGADGTGSVTLAITPLPRMHVYAHDAEGYRPFRLEFEPMADLVAGSSAYPASELSIFAPTGETSNVYTRPFRVTRGFRVKGKLVERIRNTPAGVPITLVLSYQACDDRVCYRAEQRTVSVTLKAR